MVKRGIILAFLAIVYSVAIGYVSYQLGKSATEHTMAALDNKVVAQEVPSSMPGEEGEKIYTIKEFNGNIGVFEGDTIIRIVDVDLSTFRAEDRVLLKQGIEVRTGEEVAGILEDYSS